MPPGALLVLSAALALQPPEAGSAPLERRKTDLIQQIESAAMAEPPVLSIDTQIRAAEILKGHDDAHALRFLRDAGQRTLTLTDPATRAGFLKRIVAFLTPLDAAHAESLCATQARRAPGQAADPIAACYDQFVDGLKDWNQARAAFDRALAAGAYNLTSADHLLQQAREHHPADFAPLLAAVVNAFPAAPEPDEIAHLESIASAWRRAAPALYNQAAALCRAARAAESQRPATANQTTDAKTALADSGSPLAAPSEPAEPDAAPKTKLNFDFNFNFDLGFGDNADDPGLKELPDTKNLPLDEALRVARSQSYAGARAAMLGDMIDERSAELDPPRWASLAEEALRESGHMRSSGDRLILLAELARLCHQHNEKALAASAAQSLAAAFDALVQCGDESCAIFGVGGSPGTMIMLFAEYLRKNGIEPADLGLHHAGLQARWLLLELDALFEDQSAKPEKDKPDQNRPDPNKPDENKPAKDPNKNQDNKETKPS
jgi:hypothetical protein